MNGNVCSPLVPRERSPRCGHTSRPSLHIALDKASGGEQANAGYLSPTAGLTENLHESGKVGVAYPGQLQTERERKKERENERVEKNPRAVVSSRSGLTIHLIQPHLNQLVHSSATSFTERVRGSFDLLVNVYSHVLRQVEDAASVDARQTGRGRDREGFYPARDPSGGIQ